MAKYSITHACGHDVTHNIIGTNVNGERERKAAWLAQQPCAECKRAAEIKAAQEATADLPALTGSEKQIAWATQIRADAMAAIQTEAERFESILAAPPAGKEAEAEKARAGITAEIAKIESQAASRYWIDNRTANFADMIRAAAIAATK